MPIEGRKVQGITVLGTDAEWQSAKSKDELRALFPLLDGDAAFGDFPDGVTWADIADAEKLKALDAALAQETETLQAEGWTSAG